MHRVPRAQGETLPFAGPDSKIWLNMARRASFAASEKSLSRIMTAASAAPGLFSTAETLQSFKLSFGRLLKGRTLLSPMAEIPLAGCSNQNAGVLEVKSWRAQRESGPLVRSDLLHPERDEENKRSSSLTARGQCENNFSVLLHHSNKYLHQIRVH
jgi:hypothetical protein